MTRDKIIRLAMDVDGHMNDYPGGINLSWDKLVEVVNKAVSAEREACAKIVDQANRSLDTTFTHCAAAIRARST